ncbi:RagB/SusD family nutrient uptake outer membrane protein [Dyadobacter aurulentus]|uniref:RagB/SusD family nutrient uptake outer membrane protein n=1 Tax=Dyadobacter sp. UC 10 TaxID=2605428 RepID=UPI0011F211BF|nr:RagB/SusD family nutrient uptake outer membrane protein [Dyadobacter sp. UC 10]KAA0989808.1 RagB/SusD family nutrient uptake outer membrane protein [Dyadobacter sp. UC 10]
MKKYIFYIFTGLGLSTIGCTDLVVDEKDSVVQSTGSGFTPGDPAALLASAYKDLGAYTDQNNIYALGEHTAAEMFPPTRGVDWGDNGVWRTLDAHTWDATHSAVRDTWNQLNQRVYKATEIIASNPSAAQAAEAKFLRAFNMFHVMDFWGQVPFREVTESDEISPRVMTRSEAFDYIVKDLEEALPNLRKIGPAPTNGAASKAAANALLARLYLNKAVYKATEPQGPYTFDKADMTKAAQYADAVTQDGYSLEKNYFDNFSEKATSEIIFVSLEGTPQNRWFMTLHYNQNPSGWNGFTTLADFYDTFDKEDSRIGRPAAGNGKQYSGIGYGFLIGQQVDDSGKDIVDTRSKKPLVFSRDVPLAGAATEKGIRVIKYHPSSTGKYILLRYAEVYLIKAEAMLRGGDTAGALKLINDLRVLRGAKALATLTPDALFDEIGREMYWEGGKRTVEVRFGKYTEGSGVAVKEPHTVLFPIPSTAIVSNPNLTQNNGYN